MRIRHNSTPSENLNGFHYKAFKLVSKKSIVNKNILNVGCGFGWFEMFALKLNPNKLVGIDIDKDALNIAKQIKSKKLTFLEGSAINIVFKKNTFDTVVSWEVLEHITPGSEQLMFDEIFRVLKPDGYLYLSTQHNNVFSMVTDPAWWLTGHRHYSVSKIRSLSVNSGFNVHSLETHGGFITLIYILNMYFSKWVLNREPFFNSYFVRKTTTEYLNKSGFHNIFLICNKPKKQN